MAAKLLGEIGAVSRLRGADGFAALAGVAPISTSSGQTRRMRLNRGGNRQLNRALFTIAIVQARHSHALPTLHTKAMARLNAILGRGADAAPPHIRR